MRARLESIVRMGWPVVAGAVLGLVVGGIWTLAQPNRHRAEARVLVSGSAEGGNAAAVRALAESNLLAQNVAQTLHLSHVPHVAAKAGAGGVFTLSVEAGSPERARQIDAEAAQVLTRLVPARFGAAHLQAALLDPAHSVGQTSPTPGRNLVVGSLLGLLAGLLGTATLVRRKPIPVIAGTIDPAVERRLRERIDAVTKRERALARRAGELAKRERGLQAREAEEARSVKVPPVSAAAQPPAVPKPEPDPQATIVTPPSEPTPTAVRTSTRLNINELERLVDAHGGGAHPDAVEEWRTYLFFLRDHASADGSLPASFTSLVNSVFGEILMHRS